MAQRITMTKLCLGGWLLIALSALNGQTITVIQGSDTVSSSRTVINTNFSELNTWKGKIGACTSGQSVIQLTTGGVVCATPAALCPTCVLSSVGSSVDSEVVLWSGTGGLTLKRASSTGVAKLTAGVLGVVSGSASDCVKVDGTSGSCGSGSASPATYRTVTFSATPTYTCNSDTGTSFLLTLTGNTTSSTLASCSTGQIITFTHCQDASGAHTVVFPTTVLNAASVDATAHYCTAQTFVWDGTNAQALGSAIVVKDDGTRIGGGVCMPGATSGTTCIAPVAVAGTTNLVVPARNATLATSAGTLTNGNCVEFDGSGNIVDSGSPCGGAGGGQTLSTGISQPMFPESWGANSVNQSTTGQSLALIAYRRSNPFASLTIKYISVVDYSGTGKAAMGIYDAAGSLIQQSTTVSMAGSGTGTKFTFTTAAVVTDAYYYVAWTTEDTSSYSTMQTGNQSVLKDVADAMTNTPLANTTANPATQGGGVGTDITMPGTLGALTGVTGTPGLAPFWYMSTN